MEIAMPQALAETGSGGGVSGFTSSVVTELSGDNLWGAVTPFVGFIAIVTIFALGWGIFNKYRNKAKRGK